MQIQPSRNPRALLHIIVLLIGLFWAVAVPLLVVSPVAIEQAARPGPLLVRATWTLVPVLGLLVAIGSLASLLRMAARAGEARFFRQWLSRYYIELFIAIVVYLALLGAAVTLAPILTDPTLHVLVSLAPSAGIALCIVAVIRWVRRADEYHRRRLLESFAVAAAATVLWTTAYSQLEWAGFPRLNMAWVPDSMFVTWLAWSAGRAALGR